MSMRSSRIVVGYDGSEGAGPTSASGGCTSAAERPRP
jgi:hypothetical protein